MKSCDRAECTARFYARGRCRTHYYQLMSGGLKRIVGNDRARMSAKFRVTSGCWEWLAAKDRHGYGVVHYQGRPQRAHRAVYETWTREVIGDLDLDHLCRNPGCVRPDHLEPVPHGENMRRGLILQRALETRKNRKVAA